jgi:hypothetical protein
MGCWITLSIRKRGNVYVGWHGCTLSFSSETNRSSFIGRERAWGAWWRRKPVAFHPCHWNKPRGAQLPFPWRKEDWDHGLDVGDGMNLDMARIPFPWAEMIGWSRLSSSLFLRLNGEWLGGVSPNPLVNPSFPAEWIGREHLRPLL